ncbi:hypothetical protein, partial [Pseudomonas viridiflava]|uniref:hypothetical protein n=1 Tax=Pseudomonas viridiflava TaxID=33069 RepID=UPI00197FDA27
LDSSLLEELGTVIGGEDHHVISRVQVEYDRGVSRRDSCRIVGMNSLRLMRPSNNNCRCNRAVRLLFEGIGP